jgi:hypothetical protein
LALRWFQFCEGTELSRYRMARHYLARMTHSSQLVDFDVTVRCSVWSTTIQWSKIELW